MNLTAKKLREAADYMASCEADSAHAIATVRGMFDVVESDTFGEDLGRVLNVIADELDALQARAAGANNLRQQLESAEDKAERRKRHIGYLNTALHDKNGLLQQRGGTIARLTAENSELREHLPSERERQILDMWPRFEDGEPVMIGDGFMQPFGVSDVVELLDFEDDNVRLWGESGCDSDLGLKPVIKRPVQSVLDADGVEIRVGDTVWTLDGLEGVVTKVEDGAAYIAYESDYAQCEEAANLTHTRPDSWERLEEDARNSICGYFGKGVSECDGCPANAVAANSDEFECCERAVKLDIIRRAKALAGVEVDS